MLIAAILCLALTRAEILERFRAPVVTQADGLVQVYADCPEDMRREFQMPIASFAAETVKTLYRGLSLKPERFPKAGIVIHVGDVRTNLAEVVAKVSTNDGRVVSRIYVKSPGYADLYRLKLEVIKGFFRSVRRTELSDEAAVTAFRNADPELRIEEERWRLEEWLREGKGDDEAGLKLMRKIIRPGMASARDVITFASRLFLYPPQYDLRFMGRFDCLSFRDALKYGRTDPSVRAMAFFKANEMPVFGGGRGESLKTAADKYMDFLRELAGGEKTDRELAKLLDDADVQLNIAFEEAMKR